MEIRNKEALAGQGEGRLGTAVFNALGCLCEASSFLRTGRWLLRTFLGFQKHRGLLFTLPLLQILYALERLAIQLPTG